MKKAGRVAKRAAVAFSTLLLLILITLAGGLLYLNHWLKTGDVKTYATWAISEATGGHAAFDSLYIDLSGEIAASGIFFQTPEGLAISAEALNVGFDLASLIRWEFVIDRIVIDKPGLSISTLPEERRKEPEAAIPPTPMKKADKVAPIQITLPIPVTIKLAKINDFSFSLDQPDTRLSLSGLNLSSSASAGPRGVMADALFTTSKNSSLSLKKDESDLEASPRLKLRARLDESGKAVIEGGLKAEITKVKGFTGVEPGAISVDVKADGDLAEGLYAKGGVKVSAYGDIFADIEAEFEDRGYGYHYAALVRDLRLNLSRVPKELLPPDILFNGTARIGPLRAGGLIAPEEAGGADLSAEGDGMVDLQTLKTPYANAPKGAKLIFGIKNLRLAKKGYQGKVTARLEAPEFYAEQVALEHAEIDLDADLSGAGAVQKPSGPPGPTGVGDAKLNFSAKSIKRGEMDISPTRVEVEASGDFASGNLHRVVVRASARDAVWITLQGSMISFGEKELNVIADARAPLAEWKNFHALSKAPFIINSGSAALKLAAKGKGGEGFRKPDFDLSLEGSIQELSASTREKEKEMELFPSDLELDAKAALTPDKKIENLNARMKTIASGFKAEGYAEAKALDIEVKGVSADPLSGVFKAEVSANAGSVKPYADDAAAKPFPLKVGGSVAADTKAARYSAENVFVDLGDSGAARGSGSFDGENKNFSIDLTLDRLRLEDVIALAPKEALARAGLEKLAGGASARVRMSGRLPDSFSNMSYPLPFEGEASLSLEEAGIVAADMKAEGLGADIFAEARGESVQARGQAWVKALSSEKALGPAAIDPSLDFDLTLENENKLKIDALIVTIPELGLAQTLSGAVSGFNLPELAEGEKPFGLVLPNLDARLSALLSIVLDKQRSLPTGMGLSGDVTVNLEVESKPGEKVTASGEAQAENLVVVKDGAKLVDNLNGRAPFSKTLHYSVVTKEPVPFKAATKPKSIRETSFFEDIRGGGARRESFTVDRIEAGPVALEKTVFDLYFKESRLGVDYFKTSLLGGGLTGLFQIKSEGDAYVLRSSEAFAGIDLERILKKDLGLTKGEAEIDGAINLEVTIKKGEAKKAMDISRIDASVHLSRIGAKAMDRLLLFLDPEESNPGIVNARTILKYATPARVEILAKHGNLSLAMDVRYSPLLGGMTVTMPVIKRFPITRFANFEIVRSKIGNLSGLDAVMRAVGATRLEISEDGAISLR